MIKKIDEGKICYEVFRENRNNKKSFSIEAQLNKSKINRETKDILGHVETISFFNRCVEISLFPYYRDRIIQELNSVELELKEYEIRREKGNSFLESIAKCEEELYYEIVENSNQYNNGLSLIIYLDKDHKCQLPLT